MRLYICGSMSAHKDTDYNYPAFRKYASLWRAFGHDVLDPSERFGGRTDLPYEVYIKASVIDVLASDAVAMIPGWENSRGAGLEKHIAEVLNIPIYNADEPFLADHSSRGDTSGVRAERDGLRPPEGQSTEDGRTLERVACCQEEGVCACR